MKKSQIKRVVLSLPMIIILSMHFIFFGCGKQERIQIILISVDALRGDHITSHGYFRDTSPNLSKLAEDSAYYKNTYTNGCWTMPSHMSILTGTLPSRHGVIEDWISFKRKKCSGLHDSIKTIPEFLKSCNLDIKTIKFANLSKELGFGRGFDINNRVDPFLDNKKLDKILGELENHKENNFFLFIHTWMVHAPYNNSYFLEKGKIDKKKRYYIDNFRRLDRKVISKLLGRKVKNKWNVFPIFLKQNKLFNRNDCVALYDSGIHYVDQYIGKIIDKSKHLGIYDNLMIVVLSDHGEHFGEHIKNKFYSCHGFSYYEEFIKVPLIIKYPQQTRPEILNHPVSLIDIVPTVLDYYKIKIPPFVQGESLLMPHSKRKRKYIISEGINYEGMEKKMIRVGDLKYIITMMNPYKQERVNWKRIIKRKLYDLKSDHLEKKNLYKNLKFKNTCLHMEKILKTILEDSSRSFGSAKTTKVSKETIEHMKSLGYL